MGAISFIFYNMSKPPINIEFSKSFMQMKNRGKDDTQVIIENGPVINNMNISQISNYLSKREMSEYKPLTFQYGYHRMSVNDTTIDGSQPFDDPILCKMMKYPELRTRPKRKLLCNGEIYNYKEIVQSEKFTDRDIQSTSDVEVILPLYIKSTEARQGDPELGLRYCLDKMRGDYSFILTENTTSFNIKQINVFAVRDPIGSKPLYMVKYIPIKQESNKSDIFYMFTSELKGIPRELLNNPEYHITEVPPGTYWSFNNSIVNGKGKGNVDEFIRYYDFSNFSSLQTCSLKIADQETISIIHNNIKKLMTDSVISRYKLSERAVGVLLSGGFDSCIILSILIKYKYENGDMTPIHAFTIGDDNNQDVILAQDHVTSLENHYGIDIHHHVINIQDFNLVREELPKIVGYVETYDATTIEKSIPFVFLLKYISSMTDVKILLTGDGLDELCGYSEFYNLDDTQFQEKSVNLLKNISKYDLLRCDKIAGSFGLELRQPFLDISFLEYILSIHPKLKRAQMSGYSKEPIEKYIIRKSFDNNGISDDFYIKSDILWNNRQDIRYSFNNMKKQLENYFDTVYDDIDFLNILQLESQHSQMLPKTKGEIYYKKIFNALYPNTNNILNHKWEFLWN